MRAAPERPCANPACACRTADVTCSLWCAAVDRPADVRCVCRHDVCARPMARLASWTAAADARPEPLGVRAHSDVPAARSA